jgi:type I restriction enzyme S subunit
MNGWKECRLGDAPFEIIDGDRGINYPRQDQFNQIGYCLFLNAKNVTTDGFAFDECYFISREKDKRLRKGKLQRNDVVLTTRGTVGNVGFFNERIPHENIRINSGMVIIRSDPKNIFPEYTHQLFKYLKSDFDVFATGSAQPQLPIRDLREIRFLLPPLLEQKAIAAILSSFDDKIELLRRQNKTLESIARTIFKHSFVKDKIWNGNLSEYINVQGGYAFKGEDFKEDGFAGIIKITNITMGVVDIHNTQFVDEGIVTNINEDKFRIKDGDFLIAMTGAEIGKIGIIEKTKKQIWLNQRVAKLVAKVPYGDIAGYLALRSREGQEHIVDAASGSAQANISSTGIEEMAFVPYSETDTNSFGEKVKPLFDKITFNLSQIQTLSKLRDSLLPKLMKGEIRMKDADNLVKERIK